ncbi:MAG: DNA translocase FtsK 4TM domain-containing protein [Deltaproteobacteria bacterium]|nr:DNA translocase FtsK 4TM domain-containing protein [Deltaproteobacteria bacterium]
MARPKKTKSKRKSKTILPKPAKGPAAPPPGRRLSQEIIALLLLVLDLFLVISLLSYSSTDTAGLTAVGPVANWGGKAGALIADYLIRALGLAAFWLPIILSWLALKFYQGDAGLRYPWHWLAYLGLPLATAGLISLGWPMFPLGGSQILGGGTLGWRLLVLLTPWLNLAGTALALVALLLVSFMAVTRISYVALLGLIREKIAALVQAICGRGREAPEVPNPLESPQPSLIPPSAEDPTTSLNAAAAAAPPAEPLPEPVVSASAETVSRRQKRVKAIPLSSFILPQLDFLNPPPAWDFQVQEEALLAQARKLENTLQHFGVEGKVVAVRPGPVITMIEFEPALGIKISKVTSLADDLALALKALSIRIVAPVPGKAVIGIEIPNAKRQLVTMREILGHEIYRQSRSPLTIALGKDIMGQPVVTDLGKMPHLLIAGATGTGKSVGLNAMIISILFKASPEEVRFLMVDPKRIELSTYEGIPHLLHPVVINPKVATTALRWAVEEMERRYGLLSDLEVRNIESYNVKILKTLKMTKNQEEEDSVRPLPYIVIVIDELADLMMISARETEEYLIRLAQKARAAGIHLILATQRPSVDVITGLIKANFPTRISFQVSSKVDSRTIMDTVGAEKLLGLGDLLFMPPGTSRLKRIHGPYISEEEVKRVVDFLKAQRSPEFEPGILEIQEQKAEEEELGEKDEKYQEALEIVAETRQASISMLQRRLRVGYNRAARIIEMMEKEGLVGPSDGIKAREVYLPHRR